MAADETATKRFRGETRSTLSCYALRLKPGQEIRECLLNYVKDNNLEAPFVLSCVGSVTQATLRLADASRDTPHEVNQILCICGAITRHRALFFLVGNQFIPYNTVLTKRWSNGFRIVQVELNSKKKSQTSGGKLYLNAGKRGKKLPSQNTIFLASDWPRSQDFIFWSGILGIS